MLHAVSYSIVLSLLQLVMSTPFSIYRTFVLEEKYGFNKTTPATFAMDLLKSLMLMGIFTSILVPILLFVINFAGDKLVISLVSVAVLIILVF
jgi:STE24 endopeptidase